MELASNPSCFIIFRPSWNLLPNFEVECGGHYKQLPLEMYIVGTLKKAKQLVVAFRARSFFFKRIDNYHNYNKVAFRAPYILECYAHHINQSKLHQNLKSVGLGHFLFCNECVSFASKNLSLMTIFSTFSNFQLHKKELSM